MDEELVEMAEMVPEAVGVKVWESVVTLEELCEATPWVNARSWEVWEVWEVEEVAGLVC